MPILLGPLLNRLVRHTPISVSELSLQLGKATLSIRRLAIARRPVSSPVRAFPLSLLSFLRMTSPFPSTY